MGSHPPGMIISRMVGWLMLAVVFWLEPLVVAEDVRVPMRKAGELIRKQEPARVVKEVEEMVTPDNASIVISLGEQRLRMLGDGQLYIDSPVSTGKRAGMTPAGEFKVLEKDPNHRSNRYGAFVDEKGRTVRDGVSLRVDAAPSGTRFRGAPMKWFLRLTQDGVGLHVGVLPGYPASHGCVRLPSEIAELIYQRVKVGTVVTIEP
jgi:lipoprotein-anchoring transpeptidase ErfK/SrfK